MWAAIDCRETDPSECEGGGDCGEKYLWRKAQAAKEARPIIAESCIGDAAITVASLFPLARGLALQAPD